LPDWREEGPLAAALTHGGPQAAFEAVKRLTEIFGRLSLANLMFTSNCNDIFIARKNIEIGLQLRLRKLATAATRDQWRELCTPRERELADAFTALRHRRTLATAALAGA